MRKTSGHLAEAGDGLCPFQELDSIWGCSALHPTRISLPSLFTLSWSEVRQQASQWRDGLARPVCLGLDGGFVPRFCKHGGFLSHSLTHHRLSFSNHVFYLLGQRLNNKVNGWLNLVGPKERELKRLTWRFPSLGFNSVTQSLLVFKHTHTHTYTHTQTCTALRLVYLSPWLGSRGAFLTIRPELGWGATTGWVLMEATWAHFTVNGVLHSDKGHWDFWTLCAAHVARALGSFSAPLEKDRQECPYLSQVAPPN